GHCFRCRAVSEEGILLCFLSMAAQASRARPLCDGGHRAGERPRVDDCAAASFDEIAGRELPCATRSAAAWKLGHVVPIGCGVPAGCGRTPIACPRSRRLGARIGSGVVNSLYSSVLVVHVLVAVLGLGLIAS